MTPNTPSDPDLMKYCDLMQEIKLRVAVVDYFIFGKGHALYQPPTLESAWLQLRKILELIAFGSLVANAEAYTSVYSKVAKRWQAADLLEELGHLNPEFYPIPVIEVQTNVPGALHQLKKRPGDDYLTRTEFPEVYGRCGVMAHAANPYGKGIDYAYYQGMLPAWRTKVMNLLNNHEIHLLNKPGMYVIHMKEEGDDKVHWYKF